MSDKQDEVEPTEIRLATRGQTFGLFKFTQVDVRERKPELEFDQASLLMGKLVDLSEDKKASDISTAEFDHAIDKLRTQLIEQGGVDKRDGNKKYGKSAEFTTTPEVARFTVDVNDV